MARGQLTTVVDNLCRTVLQQDHSAESDGELLGVFLARKDPAAFAMLVHRHGRHPGIRGQQSHPASPWCRFSRKRSWPTVPQVLKMTRVPKTPFLFGAIAMTTFVRFVDVHGQEAWVNPVQVVVVRPAPGGGTLIVTAGRLGVQEQFQFAVQVREKAADVVAQLTK